MLASLMLATDGSDAKQLIGRAVQDAGDDWAMASYVRNHVIPNAR
jgi:hypothetical protein